MFRRVPCSDMNTRLELAQPEGDDTVDFPFEVRINLELF
jgi:hypothetical protein